MQYLVRLSVDYNFNEKGDYGNVQKHLAGLAVLSILSMAVTANAIPITVSQGGVELGIIDSFSGGLSGAHNYNYHNSTNHVVNGPTAFNMQGQIFFYEGSDGLSFNTVLGSIGSGPNGQVDWDITITGSTTDPTVLVSDDQRVHELRESSTNNLFYGRWDYYQRAGDGGVIGELGGNSWTITIDQLAYAGITSLMAYGTTNSISLDMDLTKDIVFSVATNPSVPEPTTMLLFGAGLAGFAGTRIRSKKKKITKTWT